MPWATFTLKATETKGTTLTDASTTEPDLGKFINAVAAVWPGATIYPRGARFKVPDHDDLGYPIPDFARGRVGTVVTVDGPVLLGDIHHHHRKANVAGSADVLDLLGVIVEMVHVVRYDDDPDVVRRLSHLWMEPLPVSVR